MEILLSMHKLKKKLTTLLPILVEKKQAKLEKFCEKTV
jgi:hypothetical protein